MFRLFPFRVPNVEPILAAQMPLAKRYGVFAGFFFGFFSIVLFDVVTIRVGPWTILTAVAYGALGLFASMYFRGKTSVKKYVGFAIVGTIFYDAVTGLTMGPFFFHQTFLSALSGQIPFTVYHLVGNVVFASTLSPYIDRLLSRAHLSAPAQSPLAQPTHS